MSKMNDTDHFVFVFRYSDFEFLLTCLETIAFLLHQK